MNNYIDEIKKELADRVKIGKGLQNVYALLVLVKGTDVTLADVHDAWAVNINQHWDFEQFGNHRSLVPFDQLSEEVQEKDQKYVDAIREVAIWWEIKNYRGPITHYVRSRKNDELVPAYCGLSTREHSPENCGLVYKKTSF